MKKPRPTTGNTSGFGYLAETQKYISTLQTQISGSRPKLKLKRSVSVTQVHRPKTRACSDVYTFSYIGEVNGDLGILSTTLPISRPATSGMAARPNSPFYLREVNVGKGTGKTRDIDVAEISVQTETWELKSSEGSLSGWNGREKDPATPLVSPKRRLIRPKTQAKLSNFERYLKGQCLRKDACKSRTTLKKRLAS